MPAFSGLLMCTAYSLRPRLTTNLSQTLTVKPVPCYKRLSTTGAPVHSLEGVIESDSII